MSRVILASGSESRRQMLTAAGVPFKVCKPSINEAALKEAALAAKATPESIAPTLALDKALSVSTNEKDAIVIGADQVLVCNGRMYDKAVTANEAREVLRRLQGQEHTLVTAAVLVRDTEILWQATETPRLWMREFSDDFLEAYLVDEAEHILSAVGCYHVEGRGAQLFNRIEGDHFAIRGLPLISLLEALRAHGALAS